MADRSQPSCEIVCAHTVSSAGSTAESRPQRIFGTFRASTSHTEKYDITNGVFTHHVHSVQSEKKTEVNIILWIWPGEHVEEHFDQE